MAFNVGLKGLIGRFTPSAGCKTDSDNTSLESIRQTAKDLGYDTVSHITGIDSPELRRNCPYSKTLRRTVDELSSRHEILFSSMPNRLAIKLDNCRSVFKHVIDEMLIDGQFNWGRIVSIYAFAGHMAKYCAATNGLRPCVEEIASSVGNYVAERLADWIKEQGGWDALDRFFPEKVDPENVLWQGLLYTFVGLGALATMAAVR